jgi:formate hydrogenlyase transcriptional activator
MSAAAVDFTDLGGSAGTSFPAVSEVEHQPFHLEPEISSECCFENFVGRSPALRKVLEHVAIVAPTDSTVLLHGETGTGRELIARAIHNLSSKRVYPYVRMNCAAIPPGLLESELFGRRRRGPSLEL